jgi:hypothetical protein
MEDKAYNFLTIGTECSPAAALRSLNKREFALPFDWVASSLPSLQSCFKDDFKLYHTGLHLESSKQRLIDAYGFKFPHDYPTLKADTVTSESIGEGAFVEEKGVSIVSNWAEYYDVVKEKYDRRIERFRRIMADPKPIIVLCRHNTNNLLLLQKLLTYYYNKHNIYFINSHSQKYESPNSINIYTEKNGIWNETAIWQQGLDRMLVKMNLSG